MSEPELAYMSGTNEDFDLPRWQTHHFPDNYSSSAQAAQTAQQSPLPSAYYPAAPPPAQATASPHRFPPIVSNQQHSTPQRQPRLSQLLDDQQLYGHGQYYSPGQTHLSRSASLNAASASTVQGTLASRGRRNNVQDDMERGFSSELAAGSPARPPQASHSASQQYVSSLYPSSIAYHQAPAQQPQLSNSSATNSTPVTESGSGVDYQNGYYSTPTSNPPRRSQPQEQAPSRSPRRSGTKQSNTSLLDPYAQQQQPPPPQLQTQYSPTSGSYQYSSSTEPQSAHPSSYHIPSQAQTQFKREANSPLLSPYTPQNTMSPHTGHSSSQYSASYAMDTSSPGPSQPVNQSSSHLASYPMTPVSQKHSSASTPNTPLPSFSSHDSRNQQYFTPAQDPASLALDIPQKRRASGFRRVRDPRDLRPHVNQQPQGRRDDGNGNYVSPLKQLTTGLTDTYRICNPQFKYESAHNPRRVLTRPSKPVHNDGFDNEDYDYILYVNDYLGTDQGQKYLILDVLGQGTFGQVVKCQNMKTHEIVAVKVVKNKPAYFNQSMMEVTILELLNNNCDPNDEHHILRLRDSFIHKNHLCLVFELLSSNLYELIKQNQFQGLSTQLVKVFTAQLLDALTVLKEARLIHCDLKPENILLKSLQSPQIKVIDFGSACHERQTVYTYIQSRFYRCPEVLLGIPYTAAIDMWSLGCIAVELFLGLPLFPGTSEYNQITRIVEMLGTPPTYMLELGKQTNQFFDSYVDPYGQKKYKLKSIEQYSREHNAQEQPGKQYFKATTLPEIINSAPMPNFKSSRHSYEMEKELNQRASFIDFVSGLLNMNPIERWSPQQARLHPFITGEKFTKPFTVSNHSSPTQTASAQPAPPADPKRPYGGLVPSQPKGQRAYQDAAAYNQHLVQHQVYTAQAHAATQAQNAYRNPYVAQVSQPSQSSARYHPQTHNDDSSVISSHHNRTESQYNSIPQSINQSVALKTSNLNSHPQTSGGGLAVPSNLQPSIPANTYNANSRNRAHTINRMDGVPPALARLQHMNQDHLVGGRNALTPVLNREDAIREWERRQSGKAAAAQPYHPQLEYLQQQAEMASAGMSNWSQPSSSSRYVPQQLSSLSNSYQASPVVIDDSERKDVVMASVRNASHTEPIMSSYSTGNQNSVIPTPPQAYTSSATTTGNRYAATYAQQQASSPPSPFDTLDRRGDMSSVYVPIQPDQYQPYGQANMSPSHTRQQHAMVPSHHGVVPPASAVAPGFYGASVVPQSGANNHRNPFNATAQVGVGGTSAPSEDRTSDRMDTWLR